MKKITFFFLCAFLASLFFFSCKKETKDVPGKVSIDYAVSVTLTDKNNAPALQSFAHGVDKENWLLFAGRTNRKDSMIGGLHNLNANYANKSFVPRSYNQRIFVYNVAKDSSWSMDYTKLFKKLKNEVCKEVGSSICDSLKKMTEAEFGTIFINSNPLSAQDEDKNLYVIGGYGSEGNKDTEQSYTTFNQIARVNIPSMIKVVKGDSITLKDWKNLIKIGTSKSLISTGGELYYVKKSQNPVSYSFLLAGGHNFGASAPKASEGQKYVDAVYPFSASANDNSLVLQINVNAPISDVSDPTAIASDNTSIFRRRDGPITPLVYKNPTNKRFETGITFYGGVFKPGEDLQAWNDAIYVHPDWADNKLYTYDTDYNQDNYNVYACGSFAGLDSDSNVLHTYLLGGIGDGKYAKGVLSGFSNTGLHIQLNIDSIPLQSKKPEILKNVFGNTTSFYGAESILIKNENLALFSPSNNYSTEVIDLKKSFGSKGNLHIGYILGGIEAFEANPGTYGQGLSKASNKVWHVSLKKDTIPSN